MKVPGLKYERASRPEQITFGKPGRIYKALIKPGLVQFYNNMVYLWSDSDKCWVALCTSVGANIIIDLLDLNAPVNWLSAVDRFISTLKRHATELQSVPPSICIWNRRLLLKSDKERPNITLLRLARDVVKVTGKAELVSSFAMAPTDHKVLPIESDMEVIGVVEKYLSPLFSDPMDKLTLMWILGNALLDPVLEHRIVLMSGKGGTGKSTVIDVVSRVFNGCSTAFPTDLLSNRKRTSMPSSVIKGLVGNRLGLMSEVEFEKGIPNIHMLKVLTGNDLIQHPEMTRLNVRSSCSLLVGTNNNISESEVPQWHTSSIMRRIVAIKMDVEARNLPHAPMPKDSDDYCSFAVKCACYCSRTPVMPISARSVLLTMFPTGFRTISKRIVIDSKATYLMSRIAVTWISRKMKMPLSEMVAIASEISPYAITNGIYGRCLRGIILAPEN